MKRLVKLLLPTFLMLIFSAIGYAQTYIAVLEFSGKNVSEVEASALTDRLRSEMFRTGKFKVIEREMMDEILSEQGLQMSGCTSDECIVEMGRLIGVDEIISGSVSRVGDVYSIAARIVSVQTAEIVQIATYDHEGKIGELLKTGMAEIARELSADETTPTPAKEVTPEPVKTEPEVVQQTAPVVTQTQKPAVEKSVPSNKPQFTILAGGGVVSPLYSDETGYDYYPGPGYFIGASMDYQLGNFRFRPEILFGEKSHNWEPSGFEYYWTYIQTLSVNMLYPWQMGKFGLLLGLSTSFILSGTIYEPNLDVEFDIVDERNGVTGNLSAVELSTILGLEYQWNKILLGVRWTYDLNPVYEEYWNYVSEVRYFTGSFTAGYRF